MTNVQDLKDNEYDQNKLSKLLEEYLKPDKAFEIKRDDHEFLKMFVVRWQYADQVQGETKGLLEHEGFKKLRHDISVSILENQFHEEFLNNPIEPKSQEDLESFNTLTYVDTEDLLSAIFRRSVDEISSITKKNKLKEEKPAIEKLINSDIIYHRANYEQLVKLLDKYQATDVAFFLVSKLKELNEKENSLHQQVVDTMLKQFVNNTEAPQLASTLATNPDLISLSNKSNSDDIVKKLKKHFSGDNYKDALKDLNLSPGSTLDDLKTTRIRMLKVHHTDKSAKSENEYEVCKINEQYNLLLPAYKLRSALEQKLGHTVFLLSEPTAPRRSVSDALYSSRQFGSFYNSATEWDTFESDAEGDDYSSTHPK